MKIKTNNHKDMRLVGFLTYISRSGSTCLAQKLSELSDTCVTHEAALPPEILGILGYAVPKFTSAENWHCAFRNHKEGGINS